MGGLPQQQRSALTAVSANSPSRASAKARPPVNLTATTKRKHASPSKKRELDAALALALGSVELTGSSGHGRSKSRPSSPSSKASTSRQLLAGGGLSSNFVVSDDIDLTGPIESTTRKTPSKHRSKSVSPPHLLSCIG